MKENYQAWTVDINDFYKQPTEVDRIKFLLNFATLAPSSHNSQPWKFTVRGSEIGISLDQSRRLPESDKNDRQAYISLGCAIENILVAADYYGYNTNLDYSLSGDEIARIRLVANQKQPDQNHLIFSIPKRITNRNLYQNKVPASEFLAKIKTLSTTDLAIYLIFDEPTKNKLADVALAASIAAMEDVNFRKELSQYVKPNTTSSPIGMPGFGMGIPTSISLIAPTMIKFLNMNKLSHKKDEKLLKHQTPAFVVLATKDDDRKSWLETGRTYERIALLATNGGLSTAMWAAPIQIGEYYRDFQKILNTNFRPQAFFRLGYAEKETRHSPRLASENVIAETKK